MNELTNRQLETLESYLLEQEEELPRWFKNLRTRYRNGKVSESVVDAKCWGNPTCGTVLQYPKKRSCRFVRRFVLGGK